MSTHDRTTTLRVSVEMSETLEMMARVEGVSFSELVRTALVEFVANRRASEEFQSRLRTRIAADQTLLEALATEPTP